ncbi:hypothetical protein GO003_004900 [Methylicorpusculum oleiharenae]|uniref:hypothetical protein n=1 Tax=Methylicorpusculum oleiharenae TaxID=1338687 RepID=UPI001357DFA3|nr:hypothetical protein [Methylicorpusculum oleiharenae]MCD2449727.1 hypothetical protein [Methylicorpusculum oleiharenae]
MADNSSNYYDIEAIKGFVDKVSANHDKAYNNMIQAKRLGTEPPIDDLTADISKDEMLAAMRALAAVVYAGADLKKELGLRKKKAKKRAKARLHDETIHSEEFGIVCAYVAKEIRHKQAVQEIISLRHVGERAAEEFIAKMKPVAIQVNELRRDVERQLEKPV